MTKETRPDSGCKDFLFVPFVQVTLVDPVDDGQQQHPQIHTSYNTRSHLINVSPVPPHHVLTRKLSLCCPCTQTHTFTPAEALCREISFVTTQQTQGPDVNSMSRLAEDTKMEVNGRGHTLEKFWTSWLDVLLLVKGQRSPGLHWVASALENHQMNTSPQRQTVKDAEVKTCLC